jgi:hypothetical protein
MSWRRAKVAPDGTHHMLDGSPLYARRFVAVQTFHEPGLAPAIDDGGAFHITPKGQEAYTQRFLATWGFYEERAAALDKRGWCHVLPDGCAITEERYAWCGNFQEGRCAVRQADGTYFHIDPQGRPAYSERYLYVGDFREGFAVVRCRSSGLCTHVTEDGQATHGLWYVDLDVFHKGRARARDVAGWFHVDVAGRECYSRRFAAIEPFYNGTALAETMDGHRVLVDMEGRVVLALTRDTEGLCAQVVPPSASEPKV